MVLHKPNVNIWDLGPPFSRYKFLKSALGGNRAAKVAFLRGRLGSFWRKKGARELVLFSFRFFRGMHSN